MTQHRECCCTEQTEIECIHSDKVFRHVEDELVSGRRLYSWRSPSWKSSYLPSQFTQQMAITELTEGPPNTEPTSSITYVRANPAQYNTTWPGSNNMNEWATSGMNCMMCHHSLIMSFKRLSFEAGGYQEKLCPQSEPGLCPPNSHDCNMSFFYDYRSAKLPTEETMSALYVHWKDYWYLERGPKGVPYSWFDDGAGLLNVVNGTASGSGQLSNGTLRMGIRTVVSPSCTSISPSATDANYLCYPELKITTNPLNPYFDNPRGKDIHGSIMTPPTSHLRRAFENDGWTDRNRPEIHTVCSGLNSNRTVTFGGAITECGGAYMAGFSSWQTYMMSVNPQLRTLSDVVTYGSGLPIMPTLFYDRDLGNTNWEDWGGPIERNETYWTNLYTSMVGTLHRVRLWVRADRLYLTTGNTDNPILFPCTTGFGSYDPNDPTPKGPCCVDLGGCFDNMTQENCEAGYGGTWRPHNWCDISQDDGGGKNTTCCNQIAEVPNCAGFTCKDWTFYGSICQGLGCACTDDYPSNCTCDTDADGPSPDGRIVAFHPPLVNEKMIHLPSFSGGYTPCQKQRSGPWGILYFCSGVPVFTSDLIQLRDDNVISDANIQDLGIWLRGEKEAEGAGEQEQFECQKIGQIAETLGNSGKFNTKDWRPDQLLKYDTLEGEFRRIATDNEQTPTPPNTPPTGPSGIYKSINIPDSIREHVENTNHYEENELLPVQKTGEAFLHAFINLAIGKEKEMPPPTLSFDDPDLPGPGGPIGLNNYRLTEMSDYQLSSGSDNVFNISKYDPWHPANNGLWPPVGTERQERFPITLENHPNGVLGETFEFRYPIQEVYEAFYPENSDNPFDPDWIPEWEREMFKTWYENIPIYFHATPGGWAWSGTGWGATPRTLECTWSGPGGLYSLRTLDNIYQLDLNTITCKSSGVYNTTGCCWGNSCDECNVPPTDPFPNNARVQVYNADQGLGNPVLDLQPRDQPVRENCRTIPNVCMGMAEHGYSRSHRCHDICCEDEYVPCHFFADGSEWCGECDPFELCCESGCCVPGLASIGGFHNCCRQFEPYGAGTTGFTRYIDTLNPRIINNNTSPAELEGWNHKNPNSKQGFPYCARKKCSDQGGCGVGCKCCCPDGCDEDCYCISTSEFCPTEPCAAIQKWDSSCCAAYGSCCYESDGGKLRCKDNVSKEQCLARTNTGGFNGVFNETALCSDYPCSTSIMTKGACCYEDQKLSGSIFCRQTTSSGCTDLGGTWTDGGDCTTIACTSLLARGGESCCPEGEICCRATPLDLPECVSEVDPTLCGQEVDNELCCGDGGGGGVDCDTCVDGDGFPGTKGVCCCGGECTDVCLLDGCDTCDTGGDCTFAQNVNCSTDPCAGGEPGACCWQETCYPSLPDQCFGGTFHPFPATCSTVNCGEDPPGTECCAGCFGVADACHAPGTVGFGWISTRHNPLAPPGTPLYCNVTAHDILASCVVRHYQASKNSFRIVSYVTGNDTVGGSSTGCPGRQQQNWCNYNSTDAWYCCCRKCSSALHPRSGNCSGLGGSTIASDAPLHHRKGEYVVNIYPYTLRCAQIRDINGFQKCGLLESEIPISSEEFIKTLPRVLLGLVDPVACSVDRMTFTDCECPLPDQQCVYCEQEDCTPPPAGSCAWDNEQDIAVCDPGGSTPTVERCGVDAACSSNSREYIMSGNEHNINKGGYCIDLSNDSLFRAQSFDQNQGKGTFVPIYTPPEGIFGIPAYTCPRVGLRNMTELDRPVELPRGTLRSCAEYWQDKELSTVDFTFTEPPKDTEIGFTDYDNLGVTAPCGIYYQFVDNNTNHPKWNTFWMKQDYPDLNRLRFFSAGCWNVNGGFEGGRGISGGFAGTMVAIFGTTTGYQNFDEQFGNRNFKLRFDSAPEPPDDNAGIVGREFVGRPSRNPYWVEEDHENEYELGWTGGRGIEYADVAQGLGDVVGKVYEFCAEDEDLDAGALKPIGCDTTFSGSKGPIALFSDGPFSVSLYEFNDRAGITDGGFICCESHCSSCQCTACGAGSDSSPDNPSCPFDDPTICGGF